MVNPDLLRWLEGHINLENDNSRRLTKPTLERTTTLCRYLGDPQESVKGIHITGTNGKTSTTRITESLLRAKGLYTGLIASPHLSHVNERVCLDGKATSDELFDRALSEIRNLETMIDEIKNDPPTWYEILTAASFSIMSEVAVDVGVVEVGMGGLFDATNVCNSDVSVLTNVELDHVEYLGGDRKTIALEKSGIIKPGNKVIIGERDENIVSIFTKASKENGAEPLVVGEDFEIFSNEQALGGRSISIKTPYAKYEDLFVPLFGYYQGLNALLAVVASECFLDAELGDEIVREGLANAKSPGRLEIVNRDPLVLIDGAHNVAGAQALATALDEEFSKTRRIYVLGLTKEKDPVSMINALSIEDDDVVIASQASMPRSMDANILADQIKEAGIETVIESSNPKDAIENAMSLALDDDQIIVTGSLYLVGEVRELLSNS